MYVHYQWDWKSLLRFHPYTVLNWNDVSSHQSHESRHLFIFFLLMVIMDKENGDEVSERGTGIDVRYFPNGIFPSGSFPRVFPIWQLPKCAISYAPTYKVCPCRSACPPPPVLAAALAPLAHPSHSARPSIAASWFKGGGYLASITPPYLRPCSWIRGFMIKNKLYFIVYFSLAWNISSKYSWIATFAN